MSSNNQSGEGLDSTVETTPEDPEEESKMHEEGSRLMGQSRMTTKEKVAKLKADLKKKMALLRGEAVD